MRTPQVILIVVLALHIGIATARPIFQYEDNGQIMSDFLKSCIRSAVIAGLCYWGGFFGG